MFRSTLVPALAVSLLFVSPAASALAQSPAVAPDSSPGDRAPDGPPAPVAPATITRDARGQATVRALKLLAPLIVDGRLDEDVYTSNPPFGDLIQVVPATGQPATERTDLWLMFDDTNLYVGARVHDSAPPEQWVANEYRRDTNQLRQNDHIGIGLDTFYDRRSGFMFYATPLGAFSDDSTIDEGQPNTDWNPVWNVRTGRFDGGTQSSTPATNFTVVGEDAHRGARGRRRQLPGAVRLLRRPLRRARRVPGGGRQLRSRGRLHPARRLPARVRVTAFQSTAERLPGRAQVHLAGRSRASRERRRRPRDARARGEVHHRVQLERLDQRRGHPRLRDDRPAVPGGRRWTHRPGSYSFDDVQVSYTFGAQRRMAGTLGAQVGEFWNGTIRSLSFTSGRIAVLKQFSVEPTIQRSDIDLPTGRFSTTLVRTRADYAFSPRMFTSALVQYNSADRSFSSNVRFRWEYKLGSEFFVVYTDERDTRTSGYPGLKNRAFVVKATRFFRR